MELPRSLFKYECGIFSCIGNLIYPQPLGDVLVALDLPISGWGNDREINPACSFSLSHYLGTDRKFGPGWDNKGLTGFAPLHPLFPVRRGEGVGGWSGEAVREGVREGVRGGEE